MTQDDFQEWLRYTQECITGIEPWLSRTVRMGDNPPTRKGILHKWFLALQNVTLAAAKDATTKIHRGEIDEPKGFDRFPAAIRRAAGVQVQKREMPWERERYDADNNRTYSCLVCMDLGWVICWHPASMKAAVDGKLGQRFTLYSTAVSCTCQAGQARSRRQDWPHFNPQFWLPLDRIENGSCIIGQMTEQMEQHRLVEWMKNRKPKRPENHEPAFDDFATAQAEMEF